MTVVKKFFAADPVRNWYEAGLRILSKVYPLGAKLWEFQRQQWEQHQRKDIYFDGVLNFIRFVNKDRFDKTVGNAWRPGEAIIHSL